MNQLFGIVSDCQLFDLIKLFVLIMKMSIYI